MAESGVLAELAAELLPRIALQRAHGRVFEHVHRVGERVVVESPSLDGHFSGSFPLRIRTRAAANGG